MELGPVQLLVIGFDHADFRGEIAAELAQLAVRADAPRSWSSPKRRRQRGSERGGAIGDEQQPAHGDLVDRHAPTLPVDRVPGERRGQRYGNGRLCNKRPR